MLIKLSELLAKYEIQPQGVFHLGAHLAEEAEEYRLCGISKVIWVEANPEIFQQLEYQIAKYDGHEAHCFLVSDRNGDKVPFYVSNNGQSSSVLPLGTHKSHHPHVHYIKKIELISRTMDDFLHQESVPQADFDFLNLDLQGGELKALEGMESSLAGIRYIYTEVNEEEVYIGCPLLKDLDHFLNDKGFSRVELSMTDYKWGDAFYIRRRS
jgi:FkbM family methyltransferase